MGHRHSNGLTTPSGKRTALSTNSLHFRQNGHHRWPGGPSLCLMGGAKAFLLDTICTSVRPRPCSSFPKSMAPLSRGRSPSKWRTYFFPCSNQTTFQPLVIFTPTCAAEGQKRGGSHSVPVGRSNILRHHGSPVKVVDFALLTRASWNNIIQNGPRPLRGILTTRTRS